MRHLFAVLLIALSALAAPATTAAQTPDAASPVAFPITPDAADCTVAPRTRAELTALLPTPVYYSPDLGTPMPPVTPSLDPSRAILRGATEPATPEQIAGITATVTEFAACQATTDVLRATGLYTERLLTSGILTADLLDSADPSLPPGERISVIDIVSPRVFSDGRVGALVLLHDPRSDSPIDPSFLVFARDGDRWLIDDIPEYATAPATLPDPDDAAANRAAWGLVDANPADCTASPRDPDALATLEATASVIPGGPGQIREDTPPDWPAFQPADPEVVAGIESTIGQFAACSMTGDRLLIAALFTDAMLANPGFSLGADAEPGTAPDEPPALAVGVYSVFSFDDGRAGAVVGFDDPELASPVVAYIFFVFEHDGGNWLISAWALPGYTIVEESSTTSESSNTLGPTPTPVP